MKFEIVKQEDNRLLNRKQYTIKVLDMRTTPKREDIWKSFSAKQGLDENRVVVDKVFNQTGLHEVLVYIKYYDDVASLKRIELKSNLANYDKLTAKPEVKSDANETKEEVKEESA